MQKARQVIQTKQSEVIGTVSITPMGAWNADLNYEKDNYVRHDGATYMSRQPNKGIEPGVSQDWEQYWMLSIKDGASATVEVGETTTLPAGEQATVTNSGSDTNVVLDFAIPQGEQGLTGTVTVGNTITGQPGTEAVVENAGDEHNAILNFTIPRGEPGEPGNDPNAVHFTQQDLTDVQQQQARENIGAADAQTVEDILGGNEIVGKANADGAGNIISDTYATKAQLSTAIEAEQSAREQADDTLQTNIDNEASARTEADTTLQGNISFEATARQQEDTALGTRIDDVVDGTTIVGKATADASGNVITTTYAKKSELPTEVTIDLNGSPTTSPSFYAPITSGNAGQVLKSMGAGQAPVWGEAQNKDIANATVTLGASLTFNGSAQTQTVASVKLGSVTLRAGTDYEIAGNVATNAGNYTLIVSGKGDYTGFVFVDWTIAKAQGSISVSESEVQIIGLAGTQKQVTVTIESGYGDLVVSSSAPDKVTASLVGNAIMLTSVSEGNATITINMVGNYQASAAISVMAALAYSTLADNTPSIIRYIADNDLGASYWAVGDTYPVPLNGTVGTVQYDNLTVWAYILGFNHNSDREGEHLIHFGGFKTAQTDGVDICLTDSHYNSTSTSGAKWFNMNHSSNTNSGGWKGCDMRYDILGSTDTDNGEPTTTCATDPVSGTLMAAFPADLRAVMRPATKYTDNTGGGSSSSSNVTATQDYMPLLAEFEVQGKRTYANSAEQNYQTQYAYYANGNSKIKYQQTSTGTAAYWWCRSPCAGYSNLFCYVRTDGSANGAFANYSLGVSPAFFI